jgi:hypothetical protein
MSILTATAEDASAILVCLLAAFAEYRDSYTSGAFADIASQQRRLQEYPTSFLNQPTQTDLLMKIMLCI